MTTIFSMVLIIAIITSVTLTAVILTGLYRQKKMERLQHALEQSAAGFNLSISTKQVMGKIAIGFDKVKNKLLFLDFTGSKKRKYLVDINDIKDFSVVTTYAPISNNFSKSGEIVQTVSLQLNYKNEDKIMLLPFYILTIDPQSALKERTEIAGQWQSRLSESLVKNSNGTDRKNAFTQTREYNIIDLKNYKYDTLSNSDYL